MTYRFTTAAHRELRRAIVYYEGQEIGLGAKFLAQAEGTIRRILAFPNAWQKFSERTRRCRINRFPYSVIYQVRRDEILVIAILDLRTDPQSWEHLL